MDRRRRRRQQQQQFRTNDAIHGNAFCCHFISKENQLRQPPFSFKLKKRKKNYPILCLLFKKEKLDLEEDFSAFLPHEVRVSTVTGVDGSGANLMIVANHADRIEQEGHIARTLVFLFLLFFFFF